MGRFDEYLDLAESETIPDDACVPWRDVHGRTWLPLWALADSMGVEDAKVRRLFPLLEEEFLAFCDMHGCHLYDFLTWDRYGEPWMRPWPLRWSLERADLSEWQPEGRAN